MLGQRNLMCVPSVITAEIVETDPARVDVADSSDPRQRTWVTDSLVPSVTWIVTWVSDATALPELPRIDQLISITASTLASVTRRSRHSFGRVARVTNG
ncbi:hypothetical protein EDF39_1115 [Frondihabitans sp. PhB161]|nr:hypothetical protein EDF37_1113 [Frondihabitans sp. PhB153]RPF08718.1 hypothetical protein EDF39_1115 [Frondihabitans sp. PhB161]